MATAKWATPSAQGSNIAGVTLDTLPNTNTSAQVTYDNSTLLDLYGNVEVDLGSFLPTVGGSITLRAFPTANGGASVPTPIGAEGGGDAYTIPLHVATQAHILIFPMVRLYPCSMRFQVTNNSGTTLAGSGNAIKVQPFNESVA